MSTNLKGILCCIISGLGFGIFWIPVRALEQAGIAGIWAVALFCVVPLLLISPLLVLRLQKLPGKSWRFHASGILAGFGFALYVGAYLYTDVIHALVLYYLMPVWGFLLGWLVLGEKITPIRWLCIILALVGLAFLIPTGTGIPFPRNLGDWMALVGGMMWASVALILYMGPTDPIDDTLNLLFWGFVAAILIAWVSSTMGTIPHPTVIASVNVLWWLVPFALLIFLPTAFATMYGPSQVPPGIAGLLFMIEISIGSVTAALLTDEPFGLREIIGVSFIFVAGISEPLRMTFVRSKSSQAV